LAANQHHQVQLAIYCFPYIRHSQTTNHYTFALKMATVVFAEEFDNSQQSTRLNSDSLSHTMKSVAKTKQ
jgi:hypothetical protein